MSHPFSHAKHLETIRLETALAVLDIDKCWAALFSEEALNDLSFCDLFTELWIHQNGIASSTTPQETRVAKTELYKWMPNISPRTAVKYVQIAIERGMLEEHPSETDRRVRLINLSSACVERIEKFLDYTCQRFSNPKAESTKSKDSRPPSSA